eukprot:689667-Amphidinium_carterae.5
MPTTGEGGGGTGSASSSGAGQKRGAEEQEEPDSKRLHIGALENRQPPSEKWLRQHARFIDPHHGLYQELLHDVKLAHADQEVVFEIPEGDDDKYWDDVHGGWLPSSECKVSRALELDWVRKQEVYRKVPREEASGYKVLKLKWLDTDKSGGDAEKCFIRSRLVAKDVKAAKKEHELLPGSSLFSSTPPLEAIRLMLSHAASCPLDKHGRVGKLAGWDVSRAHLYGVLKRKVFAELPEGEQEIHVWVARS